MQTNVDNNYTIALKNDAREFFLPFQLTLQKGQITCLVGESGCGKTTLLRLLCGLDACESVQNFTANDVSYMSQLPNLLPWLTVIDNLCLAQKLTNSPSQTTEALALLTRVGLPHIAHNYPNTLSVGMQQRVCLLRTFLQKKPIILLDEPFSALDHDTRIDLQSMLVDLLADSAVLLVTHDWLDVMRLAQRVYVIKGCPAVLSPMHVNLPAADVPRQIDFDDLFSAALSSPPSSAPSTLSSPISSSVSPPISPSVSCPGLTRGSEKIRSKMDKIIEQTDPRIKSGDDAFIGNESKKADKKGSEDASC